MKIVVTKFCIMIICFFMFWQCTSSSEPDPTNNPPVISSISANPDSVEINGSCELTCIASDTDNDNLNYTWEAPAGSINGTSSNVTWIAPDSAGTYSVSCKVEDGNGGEDVDSVNIVVEEGQIPTDGLVAYYPFNGNANDESGNGNHGTIYGNSVQFVTGLFDQAIKFDNSSSGTFTVNDYVHLPNITINEMTVSHWVKFISGSSTSYDGCTYSIGAYPTKLFKIRIKNTGQLLGQLIINNTYYNTSLIDISDHEWHLITVTVNNDYIKIYNNGSKIDSTSLGFDLDFIDAFQHIALHRFSGNMSSRFTGELDNLRIYDRSLTPSEISRLFDE